MHLVTPHPRISSDIGNRVISCEKFLLAQPLVQDTVEPQGFFMKTLDCLGNFFLRAKEIICLSEHWPDPAHLEHEPLNHLISYAVFCLQKHTSILRQVHENCTQFA